MLLKLVVPVLAVLSLARIAAAAEYPCPSDPGFCYRDIGNDGCFDNGVDEGPINDEIENSEEFPVVPGPGSIVCPPSVKKLTATTLSEDIRLKTASGSSILFYAAKFQGVDILELISGDRVLFGAQVTTQRDVGVTAEGDIVIEKGMPLDLSEQSSVDISVESTGGDVLIGPKAKFRAAEVSFSSLSGSVQAERPVFTLINNGTLLIHAAQDVLLVRPRVTIKSFSTADVTIVGGSVTFEDKAKFTMITASGLPDLMVTATSGDVEIERLLASIDSGVTISGANVSIGLPDGNGVVRPSRIKQRNLAIPIDISATGTLAIDRLAATATDDVTLVTPGATTNVTRSTFKGKKATPTVTVSGGAGSTCDVTGTTVKSATLVTNCDTVVGP